MLLLFLHDYFDEFTKKHYDKIIKKFLLLKPNLRVLSKKL